MASSREEILLKRLESTIDSWNSEVTAAHEGLARQISDARSQLGVLIETLNRRAKSTNGHDGDALRSHALEQRDTALRDLTERNRALDDTVSQLEEERRTLHSRLETALADVEDARAQLAAHQEQEAAAAEVIEKLDKELAALRRSIDATSAARSASNEEIERLRREWETATRERESFDAQRIRLQAELASQARTAEKSALEIESLTAAARHLEEKLEANRREHEARAAELTAELSAAERMLADQLEQIGALTDDHTRLSGQLSAAQTETEAATARAEHELEAAREAQRDFENLRTLQAEHEQAAKALRAELDSAREAAEAARQSAGELREELDAAREEIESLRAREQELLEELHATRTGLEEARRQALNLGAETDAARAEAEAAGARERTAREEVDAAAAEIEAAGRIEQELRGELDATRAEAQAAIAREHELRTGIDAARADAEATIHGGQELRDELEAARDEANALRQTEGELRDELANLNRQFESQAAQWQENTRELEARWDLANEANQREEALRREIAALNEELDSARQAAAEIESRLLDAQAGERVAVEQIQARLADVARENDELKSFIKESDSGRPAEQEAGETAERAELEAVRQELLAFEQILIEREEAVEAAAARMQRLEETALRVQKEVAALRSGQAVGAAEHDDTADLRVRIQQLETENAEQAARIVEQDVELSQRRDDIAVLLAQLSITEAAPAETAARPAFTFAAHDESGQKKSMGEILVEAQIITSKQLEGALEEQRTAKKRRLGSILVEKGLIREEIVAQVVASQLKLPFLRLTETKIERAAVSLLDGRLATHHMCFPVGATSAEVVMAMANPLDLIAIEDLEFATHLKVKPVVATLSDITSAIVEHYGVTIANAIAEDTFDVQTPPRIPTQQRPTE